MSNLIHKRDSERYINSLIKERIELNAIDTTKISDGANTFGELYDTIEKLIKQNDSLCEDLDYWIELANSSNDDDWNDDTLSCGCCACCGCSCDDEFDDFGL